MNEEEKEAIDKLKSVINNDTGVISDDIQDDEIEIILGLINKQQKEIADLKMQNQIIRDMNLTVRLSEEVFDETYIRKDKIRKLIKEKAKTDTYNFKTIAVKDIEELLEE